MNPILKKYPYFVVPAIEELASASGEERVMLVRRIAASIGDPATLRAIIGVDPEEFMSFYPDMKNPQPSTDETIESFIDRFGSPDLQKVTGIDEIMTPAATPYDLSALEALPEIGSSDLSADSGSSDEAYIHDTTATAEPDTVTEPDTESYELSESLAKIMIRNGNYQKALEIITEISLNNPKKSIYFADQIRFLKKLIAYTSVTKEI